jgi:hypothetical protein
LLKFLKLLNNPSICVLFLSAGNQKAKFKWRNIDETSPDGIPLLWISFSGFEDFAVLSRYNPIPTQLDTHLNTQLDTHLDENQSRVDDCIFSGFLKNEEDSSKVVLTGGCPGDDSFEVRLGSVRLG